MLAAVGVLVGAGAVGYALIPNGHENPSSTGTRAFHVVHDATTPPVTTPADVQRVARVRHSTHGSDEIVLATPRSASNGRLVVFVHGSDEDAMTMIDSSQNASLTVALARAGYAILGDDAGGNAWANPASITSYVHAVSSVPATYRASGVYLIGESMGGLTSLQLLPRLPKVRAWIGIYPVCNLQSVYGLSKTSDLHAAVDAAWGTGLSTALAALSPPTITAAIPAMAFSSVDDVTVRQRDNADVCLSAFAHNAPGRATLVSTAGIHGDPSNFQPARVVAAFDTA